MRLVVGIGNADRGDDAAGLLVADRIERWPVVSRSDCSDLIDIWDGHDDVVVVDAMRSGSTVGTVTRLDVAHDPVPVRTFGSSHSVGLAEIVELGRVLHRLPERLVVYGIEGARFETGAPVSAEVIDAAEKVVRLIEGS